MFLRSLAGIWDYQVYLYECLNSAFSYKIEFSACIQRTAASFNFLNVVGRFDVYEHVVVQHVKCAARRSRRRAVFKCNPAKMVLQYCK